MLKSNAKMLKSTTESRNSNTRIFLHPSLNTWME